MWRRHNRHTLVFVCVERPRLCPWCKNCLVQTVEEKIIKMLIITYTLISCHNFRGSVLKATTGSVCLCGRCRNYSLHFFVSFLIVIESGLSCDLAYAGTENFYMELFWWSETVSIVDFVRKYIIFWNTSRHFSPDTFVSSHTIADMTLMLVSYHSKAAQSYVQRVEQLWELVGKMPTSSSSSPSIYYCA